MNRRILIVAAMLVGLLIGLVFTLTTARGQGAGSLVALTAEGGPIFAVDAAGRIYSAGSSGGNLQYARIGKIPAGHTPTCMGGWNNGVAIFIGCSDGDVYTFPNFTAPGFTAEFCGNIFGGAPTPASKTNWGTLKARYR